MLDIQKDRQKLPHCKTNGRLLRSINPFNSINLMPRNDEYAFSAFTLAEVLITLGIIGIVAALTLPNLMRYSDDLRSKSVLKETYALFQDATLKIKEENGGHLIGAFGAAQANSGSQRMLDAYTDKLIFAKLCRNYEPDCWATTEKTLYGINSDFSIGPSWITHGVLKNGVSVGFQNIDENCLYGGFRCGDITIDTNGPKPPNQAGLDMFMFCVAKDKLTALSNYTCSKSDMGTRGGYGCAKNVIMNIPYAP